VNRRTRARVVAVMLAGVLVLSLVGGLLSSTSTNTGSGTDSSVATVDAPPVTQVSDLPFVTIDALPPEAVETLQLVVQGGPYPYDRDGVVFQNREGLLPPEAEGYYREYTVTTPGEEGRGARRIVVGGELDVGYYTDDHYESFREVVPDEPVG
jgi:ribonuclease T1